MTIGEHELSLSVLWSHGGAMLCPVKPGLFLHSLHLHIHQEPLGAVLSLSPPWLYRPVSSHTEPQGRREAWSSWGTGSP